MEEMWSPIASRKQIKVDLKNLDESEEEFRGAIKDYREIDVYNDFTNYKQYYEDAEEQAVKQEKQMRKEESDKIKMMMQTRS